MHLAISVHPMLPSAHMHGVGTLKVQDLGARYTARCLAVYASLPRLPLVAQDSLPAGG